MRTLFVAYLLTSITSAKPGLQFKVFAEGWPGDWTLFEAERHTNQGVVKERAIALVADTSSPLIRRVVWYRGSADHERLWTTTSIHQMLLDLSEEEGTKITPATCKLESSFPCTKLIYTGETRSFGSRKVTVSATIAPRVRGSNLLELEVKEGDEVQWRITAIGYGRGKERNWGAGPSRAKLTVPAEPATISGIGLPDFASDFLNLDL